MKPDWKDAPEWATHLAMDSDGSWWWFEQQPDEDDGCFVCQNFKLKMEIAYSPRELWHESLEARP